MRFAPIYGRQAFKVDGSSSSGAASRRGLGRRAGARRSAIRGGRAAASTSPTRRARVADRTTTMASTASGREGREAPTSPLRRRWCWPAAASRPNSGMAHALSRAGLGPRQGARHPVQHRRRHPHGAGCRRDAVRQLVRLPRGRLGPQRPEFGDLAVGDGFQKHSYPFGIMVNATASGSSTRAPTSATTPTPSTARVMLRAAAASSPGRSSSQGDDLLRDEYRIRQVTKVTANTLEELAGEARRRRHGAVPADDRRVQRRGPHRHAVRSRRSRTAGAREGLPVPKSNWANTIDEPPFEAYRGDLRHHVHLRRSASQHRRPGARHRGHADSGLYAAGEMVGGLFYFNYPGRHRASPGARSSGGSPVPTR